MAHNRRHVRDYNKGQYGNTSSARSGRPDTSQYQQQGHRGKGSAQVELWERWRLVFKGGVLNDVNGHRFRFDAYNGDREANTERYKEVGEIIGTYVYELLQSQGRLSKYSVGSGKGPFIFLSENWRTCDRLLVLIHGSGDVRAGQWSRSLIINDSLESGTQLPYIEEAHARGWGVIVMNTNDNHKYEGSKSPNEHGSYVWKHLVRKCKAQKIAIVAHSAGGSVTASMASEYLDDFKKRVCAIALADSYGCPDRSDARKYFEKVTHNWVTGTSPFGKLISKEGVPTVSAGTTNHEQVPHYAKVRIFQYIHGKFENLNPNSSDSSYYHHKTQKEIGQRDLYGRDMNALSSNPDATEIGTGDVSRQPRSKRVDDQFASAADVLKDRWGLKFDGAGVLRDNNGSSFRFNVTENHYTNKERYENIAKLVQAHVYDLLQSPDYRLQKLTLTEMTGTFIFVSKNYLTCDRLLVLIHGGGEVRAGQWSRRLIINDRLESGSQLPYIEKAHRRGWGVVVMNTNDKHDCEGSKSPYEHGLYVWKHVVLNSSADKIAIVAHSAGGSVTASLVSRYLDDFRKRVCAIAYTDALGSPYGHDARNYFKHVACNWVSNRDPLGKPIPRKEVDTVSAGTIKHEETSHCARDDIFRFIEDKFRYSHLTFAKENRAQAIAHSRVSASPPTSGAPKKPPIPGYSRYSNTLLVEPSGSNLLYSAALARKPGSGTFNSALNTQMVSNLDRFSQSNTQWPRRVVTGSSATGSHVMSRDRRYAGGSSYAGYSNYEERLNSHYRPSGSRNYQRNEKPRKGSASRPASGSKGGKKQWKY